MIPRTGVHLLIAPRAGSCLVGCPKDPKSKVKRERQAPLF